MDGTLAIWTIAGGGSTTVTAGRQTVVDPPTRHAGEVSADRPPSDGTTLRMTEISSEGGSLRDRVPRGVLDPAATPS